MKILLLNPPYEKHFIRSARWAAKSISGSNWYPIWLAYCTGWLEKHGHEAKLLDALVEGLSPEQTIDLAAEFKPELLVLYISTASLPSDLLVAEEIKARTGAKVVLVGPWCAVEPEMIINSSRAVAAIALYEFDQTILEVAAGKPLKDIQGLWWKDGERIVKNPVRPPLSAELLNEFPFVTDVYRRHLNIKKYFQAPQLHPFVDLFTGRGCAWGQCTFCLWPYAMTKGAPYRQRRIENVLEEIKFLKKELPYVKELFIQDDTFPAERAREFSEALLREKIKLTWSCYSRANLDEATLRLMRKAGCRGLHVGFESSDPKILKLMNKGITAERMEQFARTAAKLGFIIHADFIFGLPGETVETIKATIAWAKKLPVHSYQIVTPKVYRNTPLCALAAQPDQSALTAAELERWTKRAIRECHLNLRYLARMLRHPAELGRVIRSAVYVVGNIFSRAKG